MFWYFFCLISEEVDNDAAKTFSVEVGDLVEIINSKKYLNKFGKVGSIIYNGKEKIKNYDEDDIEVDKYIYNIFLEKEVTIYTTCKVYMYSFIMRIFKNMYFQAVI